MIPRPETTLIEPLVSSGVEWLRLFVEGCGAVIIGVGVLKALVQLVKRRTSAFNSVRLQLATFLVLALEFQLAADILSTAVAPSWDKIGKLGAIAVIRTLLNFFLMQEISMEKKTAVEHS